MTSLETVESLTARVVSCRKAFEVHGEAYEAAKKVATPDADGVDWDLHGDFEVANAALHRWVQSLQALRLVDPEADCNPFSVFSAEQAALAAVLHRSGPPRPCSWLDQD